MSVKLTKKDSTLLASIVIATTSPEGCMYVSAKESAKLVSAGMVEINSEMVDANGNVATRATDAGIAEASGGTDEQPANTSKPEFALVTGVEMPKSKRGGKTATVYPFDAMEVGHSFFVPNTEDKPEIAKSLASTVSSATARYAVQEKNEDGTPKTKIVKIKDYQTGEDGKRVKVEGKLVCIGEHEEERPCMVPTRQFSIKAVEDGAPWGEEFAGKAGAGIWRVK